MKIRHWLVELYPAAWREHYGPEFEALLDECRITPLAVLDIVGSALDARLHLIADGLSEWRLANMLFTQHKKELALAVTMVIAAAVIILNVMALAAFAWFQGTGKIAALISLAGIGATFGFAAIAARKLHQASGEET